VFRSHVYVAILADEAVMAGTVGGSPLVVSVGQDDHAATGASDARPDRATARCQCIDVVHVVVDPGRLTVATSRRQYDPLRLVRRRRVCPSRPQQDAVLSRLVARRKRTSCNQQIAAESQSNIQGCRSPCVFLGPDPPTFLGAGSG